MKRILLALPVLMTAPTLALADWTGPYVHGELGMSFVDIDQSGREDDVDNASTNEDSDNFAFSLGVGYRLHRHFSIEASAYDLGDFDASISGQRPQDGATLELDQEISVSGYGIRGIGHYPLTDQWTLDGSLGLARMTTRNEAEGSFNGESVSATESSSDVVATVGIGATFRVQESFSVRAQYMYFDDVGDSDTGESEVQYVSVGAIYSF